MDLIEYVYPINDKFNKKKSGYKLTDSSIYFYYRYIYHNLSIKNIMSENEFYDNYINPKNKKNGQFDVVTKSKDWYVVYEVKFTNSKIDGHIIKEEI